MALLTAAVFIALLTTGCGKEVIKTADDAAGYIEDIARGSDPGAELADDASRVAKAAFRDSDQVADLREVTNPHPRACDVVNIISDAADAIPDSPDPLEFNVVEVNQETVDAGIPSNTTTQVVGIAADMAQSTWVVAADAACTVGSF